MADDEKKNRLVVGLVMPISTIDGCTDEHWAEVKSILSDTIQGITKYDCEVKLVSESDDIGVIQKRIVHNIYTSDVIVCDVSCKNPNVMFELGMRLAFDKPTVIVKDDLTNYSFDTGVIEHIPYPRDLRFTKIVDFKETLARKVVATYEASLSDPEHSTFLKNFGEFKVANLKETQVPADNLMLEVILELQSEVRSIKRAISPEQVKTKLPRDYTALENEIESAAKNGIKLFLERSKNGDISGVSMKDAISFIHNIILNDYGADVPVRMISRAIDRAILEEHQKNAPVTPK